MSRTSSSQPTVREALSPLDRLTPAVSAQQIYTYMQARPGYVERDRTAGSDLVRLAAALDAFGGSFQKAATRYMDKRIAEDVAEAEQLSREHPELTRNMEAWRKAAEADPAVLGKSPWVKRYVEHAILRNEAQTIDAELRNFYVTSGLVNERDTKKVAEAVNAKMGELVKNSSASKYEDPLALGPNFHRPLRNTTGNILAMHTASVEAQNAKLVMQQAHQNIDNMLRGLTDIRLPGGLNPHIPADAASLADRHAAALQTEMDNMMRLGFRQADLVAFARDSVLRTGGPVSRMEAVLQKVTVPGLDGKRVSLLSQPGVREELDRQKDIATDRAWRAEQRAWTRSRQEMVLKEEESKRRGYADGTSHSVMSFEEWKASGHDPLMWATYFSSAEVASDAARNPLPSVRMSPTEYQQLRMDVMTKKIGWADALERFGSLDEEERKEISNMFIGDAKEERDAIGAEAEAVRRTLLSSVLGAEKASQMVDMGGPSSLVGRDAEVWQAVNDAMSAYVEERELFKQNQNKGTALAPSQASIFRADYTRKALEHLADTYGRAAPASFAEQVVKYASVLPTHGEKPGFWASMLVSNQEYWKERIAAFESRMKGVDYLHSPKIDKGAYAKLTKNWDNGQPVINTVEDMVLFMRAYGRLPDTPAGVFEFLTGKAPATWGLETEEEMLDFLDRLNTQGLDLQ